MTPSIPSSGDALVVVHPVCALRGPETKMRLQWELIASWSGPLLVVEDGGGASELSAAANTYLSELDAAIGEREAKGITCRIGSTGPRGIEEAIEAILRLIPSDAHHTITGAWAEPDIARVARALKATGRDISIDESAIWSDEVDPNRDRAMAERLRSILA